MADLPLASDVLLLRRYKHSKVSITNNTEIRTIISRKKNRKRNDVDRWFGDHIVDILNSWPGLEIGIVLDMVGKNRAKILPISGSTTTIVVRVSTLLHKDAVVVLQIKAGEAVFCTPYRGTSLGHLTDTITSPQSVLQTYVEHKRKQIPITTAPRESDFGYLMHEISNYYLWPILSKGEYNRRLQKGVDILLNELEIFTFLCSYSDLFWKRDEGSYHEFPEQFKSFIRQHLHYVTDPTLRRVLMVDYLYSLSEDKSSYLSALPYELLHAVGSFVPLFGDEHTYPYHASLLRQALFGNKAYSRNRRRHLKKKPIFMQICLQQVVNKWTDIEYTARTCDRYFFGFTSETSSTTESIISADDSDSDSDSLDWLV